MSLKPNELKPSREEMLEWLKPVEDPELHLSLVDLGLIYDFRWEDGSKAVVNMTLTSPSCPFGGELISQVEKRVLEHQEAKDVSVVLVWDPKWDPNTMASEEAKDELGLW